MADVNVVVLAGRMTRKPELKYTPAGTAVCDMGLAVNESYTANGTKHEKVNFIPIIAWGRQAETCAEYLDKGSSVMVEGRISVRQWEQKDGVKRSAFEVVAQRVHFLNTRRAAPAAVTNGAPDLPGHSDADPAPPDDDVPF